jgi:hypothetical protein
VQHVCMCDCSLLTAFFRFCCAGFTISGQPANHFRCMGAYAMQGRVVGRYTLRA